MVQVSWDTALLVPAAASDARARQQLYARLLAARRPGSRLTVVVLGAPAGATRQDIGGVMVVPAAGRFAGIARLPQLLARLHAEQPIAVIAPQSPLEDGLATLAFARGRVPVVAQVHFDLLAEAALPGGSMLRRGLGRLRHRLALRMLPRYAAVRTVAGDMARRLRALGAREARSIPVPVLDLEALLALPAGERPQRLLFVGRLAPEKNLGLWLDVAERVATRVPGVRFDLVGDGAMRPALETSAGARGLGAQTTFHGAVPRAGLARFYGEATVLLLTSDHEGFGRVLVEALAGGAAVVATRTSGAREVLADGACGLLASPGDADGLAAAVVALLGDAQTRARLVAAGRRRIAEHYRPQALAGQWVDMLIEVAERHARPSR